MRHLRQDLLSSACFPQQVFFDGYGQGNGHAHHNGHRNGNGVDGNGHTKLVTKRSKSRMKNGWSRAACAAFGAAMLVLQCGFTFNLAIACTGTDTSYLSAMLWVVKSGDEELLSRVLDGEIKTTVAGRMVRPLVEMRAAFKAASPAQRIIWAMENSLEELFDDVIIPALDKKKTVITTATTA